jgi:hypothetical protein
LDSYLIVFRDTNPPKERDDMVDNNKDDGLVPPGKEKCPNCGGFGKKYGKECDVCHGEGFIPEGSADSSRDSIFPMATRKTLAQVNACLLYNLRAHET